MGNDLLERKIDTNNKNGIEDKELLNFIGNQKNVEELGTYLNTMPCKDRGDVLYRSTQEAIESHISSISSKVKNNQALTLDEKNIIKIQYFMDKGKYLKDESEINIYLGSKFGNQWYGAKLPFLAEVTGSQKNTIENRELSEGERKLQIKTILETGQYYLQFLQDKGLLQAQNQGDIPQQNIYYNELQTKYTNGEKLKDSDILFYIHQIFRDISISGTGYSTHAGAAYKEIDTILTAKQGWNKKDIGDKIIDVMYQLRQVDDAKGIYYKSSDMLLTLLTKNLGACRINRGPDSWKLNNTLMGFALLKPREDGKFTDPIVENMYRGFQHPSSLGNSDILMAFKKYKLPFEGASQEDMDDLQEKLQEQITPMKQKEVQQKLDIKKSIIDNKKQEIVIQNQQKEMIKKEFQNKNIDLTNPVAQQTIAYFDQEIVRNNDLIQGKAIEIETLDGGKTFITLDMVVTQQYEAMEIKLIADIVQKGIVYEVLQQNQKTSNFIKDMKKSGVDLTTDEKTIDMIAAITGAGSRYNGGYVSDGTFNTAVDVSKELVIQVALMAISGGIANIAAKGTLLAIQGGAKLLKAGSYATRVARYTNMSKTAFWSSFKLMPELFAADIVAEGTIFHLANTSLNAPLQGLSAEEYFKRINPFGTYQEQQADGSTKDVSSAMGYVESVAFMGVMKSFGSVTNQITKVLGGKTLNAAQQSQAIKNVLIANAITLPGEILGMQATSTLINRRFGHDIDLTPQSRAHTLALVVGLRIGHMATGPVKRMTEQIEGKIQRNSMQQGEIEIIKIIPGKQPGSVQAVEYRVVDSKGKEVDKGIASSATIDAAMQNKKAEKIKLDENEIQRIRAIQEKPFNKLTLQDRQDMGGLNEWKAYIQKNELWKDKSLSLDTEGNQNIDVSKKENIEELTLKEFSMLVKNIQESKTRGMTTETIQYRRDTTPKKEEENEVVSKSERPDLRKMNPDTQVIIDKLKVDYPGLEPLFKSMIVKDYNSEVVQQHLADLNLLPQELIAKIISKDIVFFISNEGVTSWAGNIELKGTTPRGWEETGLTWDNVAGMADEVGGVCAGKGEHGSVSLILHELGHQIDFKGIVDTKELNSLYKKLKSEKTLNDYFLQEGEAGLQEFFAETFGEYYKLSKAEFVQKYNEEYYTKLQEKFSKEEITTSEVDKVKIQKNKKAVSSENIEVNAKLSDPERIAKAKELLGNIDPAQEQAILDAHKQPGEIYNLDFSQIRARFDILQKAEFTSEQIRILMENGICGKNTREKILSIITPIKNLLGQGNLDLALATIENIGPSAEYKISGGSAITNKIDMVYSFLDTFGGDINPSDVIFMTGKLKTLKDSMLGSIELYTENISKLNEMEEVKTNARLNWKSRVEKGYEIIEKIDGRKLNESQKSILHKAIMRAHAYGHSETGKNGDYASIYNYTVHQLGKKMYILLDAMQKCGIDYQASKDIAKELLRKGICGSYGESKSDSDIYEGEYEYDDEGEYVTNMAGEMSETYLKLDKGIGYAFDVDKFIEGITMKINIGMSELQVKKSGDGYKITNPKTNEMFILSKGTTLTIGRVGDIPMFGDNTISFKHATIECDVDGDFILKDESSNGTKYKFDMSGNQNGNDYQQNQDPYEEVKEKRVTFPDGSEVNESYASVVLGIPFGSTKQEAYRAFRKVAMENHPDRNPGNKQKEDVFKMAAAAYDWYNRNK